MAYTLPAVAPFRSSRTCSRKIPTVVFDSVASVVGRTRNHRRFCLQAQRRGILQWHEADTQQTQQQGRSASVPEKLTATAARDWLRRSLEPYICRVAGVSFEGRQDLVSQLQEGTLSTTAQAAI